MQCRRDAKALYLKARNQAADKLPRDKKLSFKKSVCSECATVVSVVKKEKQGQGSALGMIAGGIGGAILGHQVGAGFGKDLATVAGAAGGAYAGRKIEEKARSSTVWTVGVRYADHHEKSFEFQKDPGLKVGDAVRNSGKA